MRSKQGQIAFGAIVGYLVIAVGFYFIGFTIASTRGDQEIAFKQEQTNNLEVTRIVEVTNIVTKIIQETVQVTDIVEITRIVEITPPATPTPEGPATTFGNGIWVVGLDILPGTYRTIVPEGLGCFWERLRGFGGTYYETIAFGIVPSGPAVVTIAELDAGFKSDECGKWERIG